MNFWGWFGIIVGGLGGLIGMTAAIISSPVFGIIFSVIFIAIFGGTFGRIFYKNAQMNKLQKVGVSAQAVILKVWDTNVTLNNNPQIGLLLEVTPPTGMPYKVETKVFISRLQPQLYQQGTTIGVKIDPDDKDKIAIDMGAPSSIGDGTAANPARVKELQDMLMKQDTANQQLLAYGQSAKAIVLKYIPLGINVNGNNPAVTLELEVIPETGKPFKAKAGGVVMETSIPKYQPGEEIFVKFDPNDNSKVTIEHS